MDITIIGTGKMARGIGARALAGGHNLTLVGRSSQSAEQCAQTIREAAGDGSVAIAPPGEPLGGDLFVLAIYYPDVRAVIEKYDDELAGTVVVDISNPVNETYDGLLVPPDSSATQELAKLAEGAALVKAFNTTFAGTLLTGQVAGQQLDVLIAGDDDAAKGAVAALARDGGLNPIDVGPQDRARELEALGLLHITLQNSLGTDFGSAVKFVV